MHLFISCVVAILFVTLWGLYRGGFPEFSLGTAFKHLLHQPRPYWVGDVKAMGDEISYGIPSTHAPDPLTADGG